MTDKQSSENLIEERGYFWWSNEPIPSGHYAPEAHTSGCLVISKSGKISLQLDGVMQGRSLADTFNNDEVISKSIVGILLKSTNYVILDKPRTGASSWGYVSHESYSCQSCLIVEKKTDFNLNAQISKLQISLKKLNDWIGFQPIKTLNDNCFKNTDYLAFEYRQPSNLSYQLKQSSILIENIYEGNIASNGSSCKIDAYSQFVYIPNANISVAEVIEVHRRLDGLLLLLTGQSNGLLWPEIVLPNGIKGTLYFSRLDSFTTDSEHSWTKYWVSFQEIKDDFGILFENWTSRLEQFQSAYYSYLSTRAGMKMYIEHQFASLIWGLESFHRRKYPDKNNSGFADKVKRISQAFDLVELNSKDKYWLKKKLDGFGELSLSERLKDLIACINLGFKDEAINKFTKECASYRNGIFHFGDRHPNQITLPSSDYLVRLIDINEVLSIFYHALLLNEIGLQSEKISKVILHGFQSGLYKQLFFSVGLSDKKV